MRAAYEVNVKRLAEARTRAVRGALQAAIAKADAELQERQRVRNVRAMMIARGLKEALESVLAAYDAEGRLVWPENVRRENEEDLAAARTAAEAALAEAERREAEFRAQAIARFLSLLKPEERPSEADSAAALFERWATGGWPPAPSKPATSAGPPPPTEAEAPLPGDTPEPAPPSPPPSEFFAASDNDADDDLSWSVVGRWTAEMMGPEIIRLTVPGRIGEEEGRILNPITQRETVWKWERLREMESVGGYFWRLKRMEEHETVDVLEWPRPGNRGMLAVRTRQASRFPAQVGFELLAASRETAESANASDAVEASSVPRVEVQVTSEPPGAAILVDGRVYREGGRVVRTPARIRITPENHEIQLRMTGYVDHVVREFRARDLRQLHGRLTSERDLPGKRVRVNPRQTWQVVEGVRVNAGDRIVLFASGEWRIGDQGEACGPDGYDRANPQFKHYYEGASAPARQLRDANYGALLFRIGFPGPIFLAGAEGRTTAYTGGVLMLDVNEGMDEKLRKDNRGTLEVKVVVIPKE